MSLKLAKLVDDFGDEQEMNRGLRDNQRKWQEKVALLETELAKKDMVSQPTLTTTVCLAINSTQSVQRERTAIFIATRRFHIIKMP